MRKARRIRRLASRADRLLVPWGFRTRNGLDGSPTLPQRPFRDRERHKSGMPPLQPFGCEFQARCVPGEGSERSMILRLSELAGPFRAKEKDGAVQTGKVKRRSEERRV